MGGCRTPPRRSDVREHEARKSQKRCHSQQPQRDEAHHQVSREIVPPPRLLRTQEEAQKHQAQEIYLWKQQF